MPKYRVTEEVNVSLVYEVEAGSEQEAVGIVRQMPASHASQDYWDWDGVQYDVEEDDEDRAGMEWSN